MTYTKKLYTVEIATKAGGSISIADTSESAIGTAAWNAILHGADVLYTDAEGEHFIAFDCICSADATFTTEEVEVEDANCNWVPCNATEEPSEPEEP